MMQCVAITGASGFVGRHLLNTLSQRRDVTVRALAHRTADHELPQNPRLHWVSGDMANAASLAELLVGSSTLVNLAFPNHWSRAEHTESIALLASAVAALGVRRVVHCSTAVVVGQTLAKVVTEATPAHPQTHYEKIKIEIEDMWRSQAAGRFELVIVRPSVVFGPHGKNLLKLVDALSSGSRLMNYLRSSLFADRRMNLISVGNLVSALELLIDHQQPLAHDLFIASEDDDPINNFRDVEIALMKALKITDYALPLLPVPRIVLRQVLRMAGRTKAAPDRIYDSSLLLHSGWNRRRTLADEIGEFAAWYSSERVAAAKSV